MRKIGLGVGAVAVVAAGAFALALLGGGGDRTPAPGGCAHVERVEEGAAYKVLDCTATDANVRVAKVVDDASECPRGGAPYTIFKRSDTLCLMPNFVEGACYRGDRAAGMKRVDCTTAQAIRVAGVTREPAECANGKKLTYVEPAVTYCLVPASDPR
ncbi:hypothetical protein ACIGNX_24420 [Actinosynnema sp. NPDC053489]|uniref:LppU/SCO3897 family protein n=1 Tax=Actinosynnema sp. NPDC053489 TaxID=3363916 RepID=UPI0037CB15DC